MYLLIGESIGMQELILIGVMALIVFGPRKLPQMARTVGKMMAEFRKATNDFKETWEREVDFEDVKDDKEIKPVSPIKNTIAQNGELNTSQIAAPEIKEIRQEDFEKNFNPPEEEFSERSEKSATGKRDWL